MVDFEIRWRAVARPIKSNHSNDFFVLCSNTIGVGTQILKRNSSVAFSSSPKGDRSLPISANVGHRVSRGSYPFSAIATGDLGVSEWPFLLEQGILAPSTSWLIDEDALRSAFMHRCMFNCLCRRWRWSRHRGSSSTVSYRTIGYLVTCTKGRFGVDVTRGHAIMWRPRGAPFPEASRLVHFVPRR